MQVRALTADDAERFQAVRLTALQETPEAFAASYDEEVSTPVDQVRQRLLTTDPSTAFLLGAFAPPNTLVGTLGFMRERMRKRQHIGVIWCMYVVPEFRNQGIGTLLLTHALTQARHMHGLEQIQLSVVQSNAPARHLYLANGFERFGAEKHALKIGTTYVDEDHMVLHLHS